MKACRADVRIRVRGSCYVSVIRLQIDNKGLLSLLLLGYKILRGDYISLYSFSGKSATETLADLR